MKKNLLKEKILIVWQAAKRNADFAGILGLLYLGLEFFKTKYSINYLYLSILLLSLALSARLIIRLQIVSKIFRQLKYLVSVLLLGIVIYRLVSTNTFDSQSILSIMFMTILLLIPDIGHLLLRIKRIKIGDLELEIAEKIKELNENVETFESKINVPKTPKSKIDEYSKISEKILNSSSDPRLIIMHQASEIERILRKLHDRPGAAKASKGRPLSALQQIDNLVAFELIDSEILPIFREFNTIRNQVVHGRDEEISESTLYQIIEIGQKIIKILLSPRSF